MQGIGDEKQHHRCRQGRVAEGKYGERQAEVAGVGEHHRRYERLRLDVKRTRHR